jgi:hypothetical protein
MRQRQTLSLTALSTTFPDDGQRQPLKGLQQAFNRQTSRSSLRGADLQPGQRGLGRGQATADLKPEPHKALRDQLGYASGLLAVNHGQGLRLRPRWNQVVDQDCWRQIVLRQWVQIVIASIRDTRLGLQSTHLAVAHIKLAAPPQALSDAGDGGHIRAVIGPLARHDARRH